MKKHAFVIQVHKEPELLKRILSILEADNHYFFIHIDKKVNNSFIFEKILQNINNIFFLKERISVHHGGISQIVCTLNLLHEVISSGIEFDYIHSLSGQDYPLRTNCQFDNFFENTDNCFMAFDSDEELSIYREKKFPSRMNLWHFNNSSKLISKLYYKSRLINLVSMVFPRKKLNALFGGWSWFSWNVQTMNYVLNYMNTHPEYLCRFNHTSCGDELIFHSLLWDKKDELQIELYNPLRFVSWHPHRYIPSRHRPFILNELDYKDVIESASFFCRKVSIPESVKLLDMIDKQRGAPFDIEIAKNVL